MPKKEENKKKPQFIRRVVSFPIEDWKALLRYRSVTGIDCSFVVRAALKEYLSTLRTKRPELFTIDMFEKD